MASWYTSSLLVIDTVFDAGPACADSIYITDISISSSYSETTQLFSCNPADTGTAILNLLTADLCDSILITTTIFVDTSLVDFILPLDTVCADVASLPLTGGIPSGGDYSGPGVAINTFFPAGTPCWGLYLILYLYRFSIWV